MKAMLFAAGLGTRLKPFTDKHPKALAKVHDKTLLEWNIRYLQKYGIDEVVVNVFHFADQIISTLKKHKGFGSRVTISDEREKVLETGGGLKFAAPLLAGEENFVAMNVDVLTQLNLNKLIATHESGQHFATLAVMDRYSSRQLLFNEKNGLKGWRNNLTGEEKLTPNTFERLIPKAFSGIQILHHSFLQLNDFPEKFSIIDVYLRRAATHEIIGYDHSGDTFIDVGKPEALIKAATLFP